MAVKVLSTEERVSFASDKVFNASKWIVLSGTLTFFLTELLKVISEFDLPNWVVLVSYLIINTILFGVAKFVEGSDK